MIHAEKGQRWLKGKLLWLLDDVPYIFFSIIIIIAIITGSITVNHIWTANKSKCLDSQAPRRWHNAICEQYEDGEWIQFDPFEEIDFYYNSEGEKIE